MNNKATNRRVIKVIAIFVLAVLIMAILADMGDDTPPPTPTRAEQIQKHFSPWGGSNKAMVTAAKDMINDPNSFEHIETRYFDADSVINVSMTFTATNPFGARVKIMTFGRIDNEGKLLEHYFVN